MAQGKLNRATLNMDADAEAQAARRYSAMMETSQAQSNWPELIQEVIFQTFMIHFNSKMIKFDENE